MLIVCVNSQKSTIHTEQTSFLEAEASQEVQGGGVRGGCHTLHMHIQCSLYCKPNTPLLSCNVSKKRLKESDIEEPNTFFFNPLCSLLITKIQNSAFLIDWATITITIWKRRCLGFFFSFRWQQVWATLQTKKKKQDFLVMLDSCLTFTLDVKRLPMRRQTWARF